MDESTSSINNYQSAFGVMQLNVKRLIDDIHNGEHMLTPIMERKNPGKKALHTQGPNLLDNLKHPVDFLIRTFKKTGTSPESSISLPNTPTDIKCNDLEQRRRGVPDASYVHCLASCLISNGNAEQFDAQSLGIEVAPQLASILIGFYGHSGLLNFRIPLKTRSNSWDNSSTMTSQRALGTQALIKCLGLDVTNLNSDPSTQSDKFYSFIEKTKGFKQPSLSYFLKYWQDPISEVQEVAHLTFARAIKCLSNDERSKIFVFCMSECIVFLTFSIP